MRTLSVLIALLFALLLTTGCRSLDRFEYTRIIMGVEASITLYAADASVARASAAAAFSRMSEFDACLSDYQKQSELMQLVRAAANEDVERAVSRDLFRFLTCAEALNERSDGAFDITISPVVRVWRDARRRGVRPNSHAIAAARQRVGAERIQLDPANQTVRLQRGTELDPGGIGKGIALDAALATLIERGHACSLVNLGGDLILGAPPPGTSGWIISISSDHPGADPVHIKLAHAGLATSGHAAQFVEIDGVHYSHLVDPATGMGLTTQLTVTVIAPTATEADGLASAVSVLGRSRGPELLAERPGLSYRIEWVEKDGARNVRISPGFPALIRH